jgi:hypothetical protein
MVCALDGSYQIEIKQRTMANNRLYIGNTDTRETFCFSKPDNNNWCGLAEKDLISFNEILKTDSIWETYSMLIIFSESDDHWFNYFFN